jgi:hypothetical protein
MPPTVSVTNSFTNATVADADEVNTNFTDLVDFINDEIVALEQQLTFGQGGTLEVTTAGARWYAPFAITIVDMQLSVGTAPTGAAILVDVHKNGTTLFTTQGNRPTVAIAGFVDTAAVPDVTAVAAGAYLEVLIDQIGSTIAGKDATLVITYTKDA